MRYLLLGCLVVGLLPLVAEAGRRDSGFSVSIGFGSSSGYHYGSGDYFDARISYSEGYRHRSRVSHRPPRVHVRERVYYPAPRVVYRPVPVYVPTYRPTYQSYDCYPNYGSYYRSTTYYRY